MPAQSSLRRLVLLRHAKSAWPHGVPDHDRPLAGKGRRNAQAVAQWFKTEGPRLDAVLCSDALRALQTWEIVAESLPNAPVATVTGHLYGTESSGLLALLGELPESVITVLVVGHEPTLSETAWRLAGPASDHEALVRLHEKYPTNGIAVLEREAPWPQWAQGQARLTTFVAPRSSE